MDEANAEKVQAERVQKDLKVKYMASKTQNEKENERFAQENVMLKNLRKQKLDLSKRKELSEKECQKLSNELQQSIQDRQELEALAKKLTQQLETVTQEKEELVNEHSYN